MPTGIRLSLKPDDSKMWATQTPTMRPVNSGAVFVGTEYIIDQKIVALRDTFGIKDRNVVLLAYVKKKIVSWGLQFYFETHEGTRLSEMRGRVAHCTADVQNL